MGIASNEVKAALLHPRFQLNRRPDPDKARCPKSPSGAHHFDIPATGQARVGGQCRYCDMRRWFSDMEGVW